MCVMCLQWGLFYFWPKTWAKRTQNTCVMVFFCVFHCVITHSEHEGPRFRFWSQTPFFPPLCAKHAASHSSADKSRRTPTPTVCTLEHQCARNPSLTVHMEAPHSRPLHKHLFFDRLPTNEKPLTTTLVPPKNIIARSSLIIAPIVTSWRPSHNDDIAATPECWATRGYANDAVLGSTVV